MKVLAKRGLFVLFTLLILCLFFAQTVRTLYTPKVDFVLPTARVITKNLVLDAAYEWDQVRMVYAYGAEQHPIVIDEIRVRPGEKVYRGQVLFRAKSTEDIGLNLEEDYQRLGAAYAKLMLQNKDALAQRVNRSSKSAMAILDRIEKEIQLSKLRFRLMALMLDHGVELQDDETLWEFAIRASGFGDAAALYDLYISESLETESLKTDEHMKKVKAGDLAYAINAYQTAQEIQGIRQSIIETLRAKAAMEAITAESDGYVTEVYIKAGEKYGAAGPLYAISTSMRPSLRAVVELNQMDALLNAQNIIMSYAGVDYELLDCGWEYMNMDGKEKVRFYAALPSDFSIDTQRLIGRKALINLKNESAIYDCVIPSKCVVSEGGKKYVFRIERIPDYWGEEYYTSKTEVSILDANETYSAIRSGLSTNSPVAANWTSPLEDRVRVVKTIS
ncbi:MAG: hypothetical protein VB065_05340 [Eubacteriales bacterium]|nr:hypothetical protein [Christensenellaceae bacterium]MEA5065458.1 hypothetical protein [Eubacteriales bacterium]